MNRLKSSSSVHQTPLAASKMLPSSIKSNKYLGHSAAGPSNSNVGGMGANAAAASSLFASGSDGTLQIESAHSIAEFLSEMLRMPFQAEDFAKPATGFVQSVFSMLVEFLMGIGNPELLVARDALLPGLLYKEIYSDALQFAMFFRHCHTLVAAAGLPDLKQSDLIRPEGVRFRQILSYVMNFWKFTDEHDEFMQGLLNHYHSEKNRVEEKRHQLDVLERELQEAIAKREAEDPLVGAVKARNERTRAELYELRQKQIAVAQEAKELDREKTELRERLVALYERESELEKENVNINSRIVQSPDRIKASIAAMSRTQAELKQTHQQLARRAREFESRLGVMKDLEVDLRGLIDLAKGVDGDRARVAELKNEITRIENDLAQENVRLTSTISRIEQLERQITHSRDRLERQQRMADEVRSRAKEQMDHLRAVHAHKAKDRAGQQREVEAKQAEKRAMQEEIDAFREQSDLQVNQVVDEYFALRDRMEGYMRELNRELGLDLDVVLGKP